MKPVHNEVTVGDLIKPGSLNILRREDKEIMLYALRKISEDLNTMECFMSEVSLKPEQMLRFNQFIRNNKARVIKVIWGITGSHLKELDEMKEEKKK